MAYGIEAWYCCLDDIERCALEATYDAAPRFLPHTCKDIWLAVLEVCGLVEDTVRYQAFLDIYGVYFVTQGIGDFECEVPEISDDLYLQLTLYYADHGRTCPDPCKIRHFSDI